MSGWFTRDDYPYDWIETGYHYSVYDSAERVFAQFTRKPEEAVSAFIHFVAEHEAAFCTESEMNHTNTAISDEDIISAIIELLRKPLPIDVYPTLYTGYADDEGDHSERD